MKNEILDSCFSVTVNANDTFGYACAESHTFNLFGICVLKHIYNLYGQDGITALMAYEQECNPIEELQTPEYHNACSEITRYIENQSDSFRKYYKEEIEEESKQEEK